MQVTVIQQYEYVTDTEQSKSKPVSKSALSVLEMLIAFLLAVWPLIFLSVWYWLTLVPVFISRILLADYFKKWIGGYTGDCLGAIQQVTEIIFYLSALIVWRYIL
jgi:adenosylcobinamide-GDP ribazoletransferase